MKKLLLVLILTLSGCGTDFIEEEVEVETGLDCPVGEGLSYYKWRDDFESFRKLDKYSDETLTIDYTTGSWKVYDSDEIVACGLIGKQELQYNTEHVAYFYLDNLTYKDLETPEESYGDCEVYYVYDDFTTHTPYIPANETEVIFKCGDMFNNRLNQYWVSF